MIELVATDDGVLLSVRAQPGARRNGIRGEHDGALKVSVTQAAEKGKANSAIAEALADALDISRSQTELQAGATTRRKQFLIRGLTVNELSRRIETALSAVEERK